MHIEGLDELDNRILTLLTENARLSYSEIGEKVGLSRVSVRSRMTGLEEKGIIRGYHAVIDPARVPDSIRFLLDVETSPESYNEIVDAIADSKMIRQIFRVTGECRIHAVGLAPNTKEMTRFANSLYSGMKGVRRLRCDTVLSVIKDLDGGVDYVRCEEHEHLEGGAAR
ncbi:MAG: Lrp/AsnC family transcriptional regulator [Blautia sp.]|nr:Lrp/AsnC family transcriptional regulator [Blautia sp.]